MKGDRSRDGVEGEPANQGWLKAFLAERRYFWSVRSLIIRSCGNIEVLDQSLGSKSNFPALIFAKISE